MNSTKPLEFTGIIIEIGKEQIFPSGFTKRQFVIVDDPDANYPNEIPFELTKSKGGSNLNLIDRFEVGKRVTVKFYLNAFQGKTGSRFVSLRCVGIEGVGGDKVRDLTAGHKPEQEPLPVADDDDRMPF